MRIHLAKHFEKFPDRVGSLTVLEVSAAQSAPKELREESSKLMREFQSQGAAIIVEGTGFRAATIRTLIAGLYLLQRTGYPHKIAATVADGVEWLLPTLKRAGVASTMSAGELVSAVESTREKISTPRQS